MASPPLPPQASLSPVSPSVSRLESLTRDILDCANASNATVDDLERQSERLQEVRLILIDSSRKFGRVKDDFRRFGGFEACLQLVESFPAFLTSADQPDAPAFRALFEALRSVLAVLSEALLEHVGNRDYFAHHRGENDWLALERALVQTCLVSFPDAAISLATQSRIFSLVFAFALREEDSSSVFKHWRSDAVFSILNGFRDALAPAAPDTADVDVLEQRLSDVSLAAGTLWAPEAIGVIVGIWRRLSVAQASQSSGDWPYLSQAVLQAIGGICAHSEYNAVSVHSVGVCRALLDRLLDMETATSSEALYLSRLCNLLLRYGVHSRDDARHLFQMAQKSPLAKGLLLTAIKDSRRPAHFIFDLSLHGFASIEFAALGQDFPPQEPSSGYTFTAWLQINAFDRACHTTLCGAFDESQTCFFLLYVERDSRQLVLQTSVTTSRPSVRFRSVTFKPERWYHIALVHQRPRSEGASRATLFINGEFCEHLKCHYPQQAPLVSVPKPQSVLQPARSRQQRAQVQAFFGTPRDLSPRPGSSMLQSRWNLACAQLVGETLPDELIFVQKNLGPEYQGNYRDSLGSFQTYSASASLNIQNERLNPTQEDRSLIARAVKGSAGSLVPESSILLNISALRVVDSDALYHPDRHGFGHVPSRTLDQLQRKLRSGGIGKIAVNQAIPKYIDALSAVSGTAVMTGGMGSCKPGSLDSWSWRLSGCVPVALQLVMSAATEQELVQGLDVAVELVRDSWRNSETFERENGFALLAWLIRGNLQSHFIQTPVQTELSRNMGGSLSLKLLRTILEFVGYDHANAENSVLNNPLAYRSLLLDSDMWRSCDLATQALYYKQFVVFASASKNSDFNLKRLVRMRAAKKILDSLKGAAIHEDALQYLLDAFKVLFIRMPSTDLYRSLALYITYATSSASLARGNTRRSQSADALRKTQSSLSLRAARFQDEKPEPIRKSNIVSREDLGARVLKVFADVLLREDSTSHLRRFAKTVTNKWLLFLLMTQREDVVVSALSITGKLLVTQPQSYCVKFEQSSRGFAVLKKALRRWSASSEVWKVCLALLFGADVAQMELDQRLTAEKTWTLLQKQSKITVLFPSMLPVLTSMLESILLQLRPSRDPATALSRTNGSSSAVLTSPRESQEDLSLQITSFFQIADAKVGNFRSTEIASHFVRDSMRALSATMTASNEDDYLTDLDRVPDLFKLDEPRNAHDALDGLLGRAEQPTVPQTENTHPNPRKFAQRRLSSYVLIRSDGSEAVETEQGPGRQRASSKASLVILDHSGTTVLEQGAPSNVVDILVSMFTDQILTQKDFTGLGLFMKAAAGSPKRRAILNSYLIARTSSSVEDAFNQRPDMFKEPRAILNLTRFTMQAYEALVEGWYINGTLPLISFCSRVLLHLRHGSLKNEKGVLLCFPALWDIQLVLRKATIFQLHTADASAPSDTHQLAQLENIDGWRLSVVPTNENDEAYCGAIVCCLLRILLTGSSQDFGSAVSLLKSFSLDDPERLIPAVGSTGSDLTRLRYEFFSMLLEHPTELQSWVKAHEGPLVGLVRSTCKAVLEPVIGQELSHGASLAKARSARRKERLEQWHLDDVSSTHTWTEFTMAAKHWTDNIYSSESRRLIRMRQDQQENSDYLQSQADGIIAALTRLEMSDGARRPAEFALDNIEGRDRMRLRLAPVIGDIDHSGYEPKRTKTMRRSTAQKPSSSQLGVDTSHRSSRVTTSPSPIRDGTRSLRSTQSQHFGQSSLQGEDFEVVASPNADDEDEDKNRKVMRSLERGEQVKNVYNVSKIVGLEAYESLLIIGNNSLYLIGGLFQRSDGEVVSVRHAPSEERDKYTQIITGREVDSNASQGIQSDSKSHWLWADVLSVSKRQFLTRPVALEFFFADGRSFLMTALDSEQRNSLHAEIIVKISDAKAKAQGDPSDAEWRMDLLRDRDESTSRFSQVLAPMLSNPVTRRWMKGELSNFHYLMYVNTMAGRTFNDLTQYPVFPWVIADYTSEELDLSSPYTYRDLTKPMGCQNYERAEAFKERYSSFAEMDDQTPAFHYGTHYSTAMIVTSFLIRLQPFVHSHVLLQGGSFDFADRLFFSVEKAWQSASNDTLSDVRELIPEFFYLPDFLTNVNGYDFGTREGSGDVVNDVQLPPWAKGDPKIFIAKNREALESPYVSQNLHSWIDLIFGFKQRGEAAIEAVNVFHYLSYPGAKDLDKIQDQHERKATIGIIHNFGQTPRQIFSRPHDRREGQGVKNSRVRKSIQSMAMLTTPVLERSQTIVELQYSRKLYAASPQSVLVPPSYNTIMDWNFTDHSVRFSSLESGKCLGIFEQLHQLPLSSAHFSDRKTLTTASEDCTMSVWSIRSSNDRIELQPRASLFEHQAPVTVLTSSKAFGTLLSASTDGAVHLWDLNRLELIRKVELHRVVESARISETTGHVLLCCDDKVLVYTLNGQLLVDQRVCQDGDGLTSCAFRGHASDAWTGSEIIYTGHKLGLVNVWELSTTSAGQWVLVRINQLRNDRRFAASPSQRPPWITCILPHEGKVFIGDRDGRAYEWNVTK